MTHEQRCAEIAEWCHRGWVFPAQKQHKRKGYCKCKRCSKTFNAYATQKYCKACRQVLDNESAHQRMKRLRGQS